ncbi:hypothetical protein [Geodermatophilus aquaeductus]|uniref:hypothetical protein n=1 Tax=Geodermatophilus aquaeductus TaxID=1564161 RepID=UPI00115A7920|nr:hypothetical protein [Geodermatophilus aquaeductus]
MSAVSTSATDGLSLIATAGFFVPAAVLVAVVVMAVVRDRRLAARDRAEHDGGHERIGSPAAGDRRPAG